MKKLFLDVLSLSISLLGSVLAASFFAALVLEIVAVLGIVPDGLFDERFGDGYTVGNVTGGVIGVIFFIVIFRFTFFRLVAFMRREYLD